MKIINGKESILRSFVMQYAATLRGEGFTMQRALQLAWLAFKTDCRKEFFKA